MQSPDMQSETGIGAVAGVHCRGATDRPRDAGQLLEAGQACIDSIPDDLVEPDTGFCVHPAIFRDPQLFEFAGSDHRPGELSVRKDGVAAATENERILERSQQAAELVFTAGLIELPGRASDPHGGQL